LWLLKIRPILPAYFIQKVKIEENNESMVNINNSKKIFVNQNLSGVETLLRKSVIDKLNLVIRYLPNDVYLKINEAYRSLKKQEQLWNEEFDKTDKNLSNEERIILTKRKIAYPFGANVGGHQTGGAVDVTLCDFYGKELDMGTQYLEFNDRTKSFTENVSQTVKTNRNLLFYAMKGAGFINYPNEWWHFSYGDQMWAAYNHKTKCFYGKVDL